MKYQVHVTLKESVLDPQGSAIKDALDHNGFDNVKSVRLGKYFEIELTDGDKAKAEASLDKMCEKLLSNPVIETYRFTNCDTE